MKTQYIILFTFQFDRHEREEFETGRKYADDFKENMKIKFDKFLPKWNYVVVPN